MLNKLKWKYVVGLGVIISILGGIAEFSGYSLSDLWLSDEKKVDYFNVTVFVHGKEGKHSHILENRGKVVMQSPTDRRDEKIGDKGEVNFKELPASFKNQKVTFYITDTDNEPYQVINPDSLYILTPNKAIHLQVMLANIDQIKGTLRDKRDTSKRIADVKVCIENICVNTDKDGRFLLKLPEEYQKKFQTISFRKECCYKEYVKHNVPMQLEGDFDVVLEPKS
ncbi:hypothetical protein [Kordia sp.]|uniref:hypothetical protein n=1 Tax=Kordia sp. TaxID=1965332 RepID=UPI003D2BDB94